MRTGTGSSHLHSTNGHSARNGRRHGTGDAGDTEGMDKKNRASKIAALPSWSTANERQHRRHSHSGRAIKAVEGGLVGEVGSRLRYRRGIVWETDAEGNSRLVGRRNVHTGEVEPEPTIWVPKNPSH